MTATATRTQDKARRNRKRWAAHEDAAIRSGAGRLTQRQLSQMLGRSERAVSQRQRFLGVARGRSPRGRREVSRKLAKAVVVEGVGEFPSLTAAAEALVVVRSGVSMAIKHRSRVAGRLVWFAGDEKPTSEKMKTNRQGVFWAVSPDGTETRRWTAYALAEAIGFHKDTVARWARDGSAPAGWQVWFEDRSVDPGGAA